jgi:hypothetical protein
MPPDEIGRPGGETETAQQPASRATSSVTGTDAEVLSPLSQDDARRLDQRIRLMANTIRDNVAKIATLVEEAKAGQIHMTLGFSSWTAYLADALGGQLQVHGDARRELVGFPRRRRHVGTGYCPGHRRR